MPNDDEKAHPDLGSFHTRDANEAELAIYPGGAHGFTLFPNELSKSAQARMDVFLNRVLG
jgi:hypothetical protein